MASRKSVKAPLSAASAGGSGLSLWVMPAILDRGVGQAALPLPPASAEEGAGGVDAYLLTLLISSSTLSGGTSPGGRTSPFVIGHRGNGPGSAPSFANI